MARCYSKQHSDQMVCPVCNLRWDVNDPDPPRCDSVRKATIEQVVGSMETWELNELLRTIRGPRLRKLSPAELETLRRNLEMEDLWEDD